jgi:hypothetical protein
MERLQTRSPSAKPKIPIPKNRHAVLQLPTTRYRMLLQQLPYWYTCIRSSSPAQGSAHVRQHWLAAQERTPGGGKEWAAARSTYI